MRPPLANPRPLRPLLASCQISPRSRGRRSTDPRLRSSTRNLKGPAESRDDQILKTLVERLGRKEGFIPYAGLINPRSKEIRSKFPKSVENNGHKYDISFIVVHFGNEVPRCHRPLDENASMAPR